MLYDSITYEETTPLIPKSRSHEVADELFSRFDFRKNNLLQPIELIKFQKYINRLFTGRYLSLKPKDVFKTIKLDADGNATREAFRTWVIENLTYEDSSHSASSKNFSLTENEKKIFEGSRRSDQDDFTFKGSQAPRSGVDKPSQKTITVVTSEKILKNRSDNYEPFWKKDGEHHFSVKNSG